MKKVLSFLVTFCMLLTLVPMSAFAESPTFSDMPSESRWSYAALRFAADNGLLKGSNGKIMASADLTRVQMATIINRVFGAVEKADVSSFTDVKPGTWTETEIAKAVCMGTFQGSGDKMRPNDSITRQEAFVVLARAFKLGNGEASDISSFADAKDVGAWALPELAALVKAGYVNGDNNHLNPKSHISREQFAQVLYNMNLTFINEAGEYTGDYEGSVMINVPDVTLKGCTIKGDLIIGDGVGNGDCILDDVHCDGRTVVRGGGENSIRLLNGSSLGSIVVSKTSEGNVRVFVEKGCSVEATFIDDGKDDVILEGSFSMVTVDTDAKIVLNNADIIGLNINAKDADVSLEGKSSVSVVEISKEAEAASLAVAAGTTVTTIKTAASGVTLSGDGKIKTAIVSGNDTKITTKGTSVSLAEGTTGLVNENGSIAGGGSASGGGGGSTSGDQPAGCSHPHRCAWLVDEGYLSISCDDCHASVSYSTNAAIECLSSGEAASYTNLLPEEYRNNIQRYYVITGEGLSLDCDLCMNPEAALIVNAPLTVKGLYIECPDSVFEKAVINKSTIICDDLFIRNIVFINDTDCSVVTENCRFDNSQIDNNGELSVTDYSIVVESSVFKNCGSFNCEYNIYIGRDASLSMAGSAVLKANHLYFRSSDADLQDASEGSIRTGGVRFEDGYYTNASGDVIMCNVTMPAIGQSAFVDSGSIVYEAFVYGAEQYAAAATESNLQELKNKFYQDTKYNLYFDDGCTLNNAQLTGFDNYIINGNTVTLTGSCTLSKNMQVFGYSYNDGNVIGSLVISGGSLTVAAGGELSVQGNGEVHASDGAITCEQEGRIKKYYSIIEGEDPLNEPLIEDYDCDTFIEFTPKTQEGLYAALENPEYDWVTIYGSNFDPSFTIDRNITIARELEIAADVAVNIADDAVITVEGCINNHGTLNVYGNVNVISGGSIGMWQISGNPEPVMLIGNPDPDNNNAKVCITSTGALNNSEGSISVLCKDGLEFEDGAFYAPKDMPGEQPPVLHGEISGWNFVKYPEGWTYDPQN